MSTTAHDPATGAPESAGGPSSSAAPSKDAADYVRRVREALVDLPPEVVDDLVDGLHADLAELAGESSTPLAARLGPPEVYAGELRGAAGVAPRGAHVARPEVVVSFGERWSGLWTEERERLHATWTEQHARLRAQPWWPQVSEFAHTIRPAWWVARAAIAMSLGLSWVFGVRWGVANFGVLAQLVLLAVLVGAVVVSVQLGRGRWSRVRWVPRAVLVGNVVAVLAIPATLSWAAPTSSDPYGQIGVSYVTEEVPPQVGLYLDGQVVSNLYPYDAQGRPLSGVQLLDDYGRPVVVGEDQRVQWASGSPEGFRPAVDVDGVTRWNAYPLSTGIGEEVAPETSLSRLLVASGGAAVPADEALEGAAEGALEGADQDGAAAPSASDPATTGPGTEAASPEAAVEPAAPEASAPESAAPDSAAPDAAAPESAAPEAAAPAEAQP